MDNLNFTKAQYKFAQETLKNEFFNDFDFEVYDSCHDGSSYDGFFSHCDGWNEFTIPFEGAYMLHLSKDVQNAQKEVLDGIDAFHTNSEFCEQSIEDFLDWANKNLDTIDFGDSFAERYYNQRKEWYFAIDNVDFCEKYPTFEDFKSALDWGRETIDLTKFNTKGLDMWSVSDSVSYSDMREFLSEFSSGYSCDSPSYLKYKFIRHGKQIDAYIVVNDDFGYGREWVNNGYTPQCGDHDIHAKTFEVVSFEDYLQKVRETLKEFTELAYISY